VFRHIYYLVIYKKIELLFINKILIIIQYREIETKPEMSNDNVSSVPKVKKSKNQPKKKVKLIIEDDENTNITFTILTEEVPSYDEITFMLGNVLKIEKSLFEKATIMPNYINGKFKGEWEMQFDNYKIIIKLFKGESSCPDYLLCK